jgi:citrate synthase
MRNFPRFSSVAYNMENDMESPMNIKNIGLRDIPIADTLICGIDPKRGKLIYRGFDIVALAANSTYEETAFLLLHAQLPTKTELNAFQEKLVSFRTLPDSIHESLKVRPASASPMDVLQGAVSFLADHDPDIKRETRDAEVERGLRLIAVSASVVAAWDRIRRGKPVVAPDPELTHAANFLYMLHGQRCDPQTEHDFDVCLILHAEHSFNASTFTARAVASTRSHTYGAVAAAVASLAGELHGGANTRVMEMLEEIGSADRASSWIKARLRERKKIMGLGHAVYQVDDPRAGILAPMAEAIGKRTGDTRWVELAWQVERLAKEEFRKLKGRTIPTNVDFYSAPVYRAMGIPKDLFTPVFAVSRMAGWMAHILEEKFAEAQEKPVLYRPQADYIGSYCGPDTCEYIPAAQRS